MCEAESASKAACFNNECEVLVILLALRRGGKRVRGMGAKRGVGFVLTFILALPKGGLRSAPVPRLAQRRLLRGIHMPNKARREIILFYRNCKESYYGCTSRMNDHDDYLHYEISSTPSTSPHTQTSTSIEDSWSKALNPIITKSTISQETRVPIIRLVSSGAGLESLITSYIRAGIGMVMT
jgi:hypothetical protein